MAKTQTTAKFSTRLKRLIDNSGKTLYELSKEIGIARMNLIKYKNDEAEPSITPLASIASYFNVSADYLIGLTDYSNPQHIKRAPTAGIWESNIDSIQCLLDNKEQALRLAEKDDSAYGDDPAYIQSPHWDEYHYYDTFIEMTNLLLSGFLYHQNPDRIYFPQALYEYLEYTAGGLAQTIAISPLGKTPGYTEEDAQNAQQALIASKRQLLSKEFWDMIKQIEGEYEQYLELKYSGGEVKPNGNCREENKSKW